MGKIKRPQDWHILNTRIPVTWRPDPHKRARVIPSKKLYKRKARTPSGSFHFEPRCLCCATHNALY
jgi:hypothetical protein